MSELSEAERLALAEPLYEAWRLGKFGAQEYELMWHELDSPPTSTPEHEALYVAVERILAARVASAAAERDQAVAVADSMQHFADVAEVCERKSNEYAAENAALRARLDEVRALADDWARYESPYTLSSAQLIERERNRCGKKLRAVLAAAHDEGSESAQ